MSNKIRKALMIFATVSCVALTCSALAACGGEEESTSLRTQLETPTNISYDFEEGTISFTAVENATYYRIYFYNVTEPDDDLGNTDYFESHTEEVTETYPDGQTATNTQTVYTTDDNGNYVLKSTEEILAMTSTYSKRYNAYYYDEDTGTKTYYNAGDTVSFELPNDSIAGGTYIIAVKAGGPLALYTMSEYLVDENRTVVLHNVTPEIQSGEYGWSWSMAGQKITETTNPMGTSTSASADNDNPVLDGTGMMFEISNAASLYNANPSMTLTYYIEDSNGNKVSFNYYNVQMARNDSNTFCGWALADSGEGVTEGTASLSYSIYSHSGPTMFYSALGFFYITGLTEGETYTLYITAPGDGGVTSYDSAEGSYTFTFEAMSSYGESSSSDQGGDQGGDWSGDQGGEWSEGGESGDQTEWSEGTESGDQTEWPEADTTEGA